jgi:D-alanine-D-alanine ligase
VAKLRVGVIYGGRSGEHEVSIVSASAVMQHLDPGQYDVVPIYIRKNGQWRLAGAFPTTLSASEAARLASTAGETGHEVHLAAHPGTETLIQIASTTGKADGGTPMVSRLGLDVVFPLLHGPYGEDGTIQGLLELAGIPYVGAGVLGSAVAMDKAVAKTLFAAADLPQTSHVVALRREWHSAREDVTERVESLGYPVFVKPANMGSSVGISKVDTREGLASAMTTALAFDRKVVVEAAVTRPREIECAVLGNDDPRASVPGEVLSSREFYDYEAKYLDDDVRLLTPAPISDDMAAAVRRIALEAFRAVDASGMARVDFLLSRDDGRLFVNEVNTIPGFTTVSMYPKLWEASGLSYRELLSRLIALAVERHSEKQLLRTSRT